ncbi:MULTISPECIES: NADH-quinone oxidoreductase subunit NuoK [Candidatus Ichthyocystis]|uniref:NADH-quinone oxidoreductase subunit NuoK n=1 Tax=Candidatus Ichthyocystis TaxID=2929841 RepID=UPI001F5EB8EF|nr:MULTISPECIES: NADH-quinone oxidoreductase subunit NuoK [Ichthyocystis]
MPVSGYLTLPHMALLVSLIIFAIGLVGVIARRGNLISVLMSIELMLLSVNTNFMAFSAEQSNPFGWCFVFFVLTVAAVESATGLAIVILVFRNYGSILVEKLNRLKD